MNQKHIYILTELNEIYKLPNTFLVPPMVG